MAAAKAIGRQQTMVASELAMAPTEAEMPVPCFMGSLLPALHAQPATIERYDVKQKPVASWEDSQYSFSLVRSSFTDRFGLVISSKRVNAEAELAIVEAARLEKEEGPRKEAERQKKLTDDLETARQKNRKIFRP